MKRNEMIRKSNSGKILQPMVLAIIIIGFMVLVPMAVKADSSNPNPGVLSPEAKIIYEELSVKWWQWALEIPNKTDSIHPILDTTGESCDIEQSGPVWFLAGTAGGDPVTRICTIPSKKAILIPIINAATWIPTDGSNKKEIKEAAKNLMDHVETVEATVDGVDLKNLKGDYRFQSRFFTFTGPDKPDETIFPGQSGFHVAVADGFWILVSPLSKGQHEIHVIGIAPFPEFGFTFRSEVTYHLTVK